MPDHVNESFCLRIPVRFTHTDPAGFVFFPRYFEMIQAVVEDWFTHAIGVRYAERYQPRAELCVRAPTGQEDCASARVRRHGRVWGVTLRWSRHFPHRGSGTYGLLIGRGGNAVVSFAVR